MGKVKRIRVKVCLGILQDSISKINKASQAPMAHACNPSYSGGRDQEDHGSKPVWANSSQDPILKKPITRKGWWSDSR
jgi:hypothetical protein